MNQMPRQNLEPAEWLGWTDEYAIDRDTREIVDISWDSFKEFTGNLWGHTAPAVRINGQWFIQWDFRIKDLSFWTQKTFAFSDAGWVRFDPSFNFSATTATSETLPDGTIEAFGFWNRKSFAFNNSYLDNFKIRTAERAPAFDFTAYQDAHFDATQMADPALSGPGGRADGTRFDNRTQFFMGLDPNAVDGSGLLEPEMPAGDVLRIRYQRGKNAHGVSGTVKWSTDLQTWSSEGVRETLIADTGTAWLIEAEVDKAGRPTLFLTLEITEP